MDNNCNISYGNTVFVIPGTACKKIVSGDAALSDIRVLVALCSEPSLNGERTDKVISEISEITGLVESKVENAIAFWRGCGVLEFLSDDSKGDTVETRAKPKPRSKGTPAYSGNQISELLDKDGGRLKTMIDQCQQILGRMFNATESSVMVGMCDWLGLEPEFVVTMTAYYTNKKPGCNVRYLEKAATDLVNNGITTLDDLDSYLKEMELYDGIAGKLRSWLGIGARAYTQKENGMIKRWVKDFSYDGDVVRYAYELTVDAKGEFNFDYANKILENWFKSGVKTKFDAESTVLEFKREKDNAPKDSGSFDTDEFFSLALKRSYSGMKSDNK